MDMALVDVLPPSLWASLSNTEQQVVELRWRDRSTLRETAQRLGMSGENVRLIEERATTAILAWRRSGNPPRQHNDTLEPYKAVLAMYLKQHPECSLDRLGQ